MGHASCIPERDPSVLLARGAEQFWVSGIPCNVIDLIAVRAGEQGCGPRLHLKFVPISALTGMDNSRTTTYALLWLKHPHHSVDSHSG
jgi:hypothetical protein